MIHCKHLRQSDANKLTHLLTYLLWGAGLEVVYFLMRDVRQKLRVELEDWEGNTAYALYDNFEVGGKRTDYTLIDVGKYSGTAGRYAVKTLTWYRFMFTVWSHVMCTPQF